MIFEPYDDNNLKHVDCYGWAISEWQEWNDMLSYDEIDLEEIALDKPNG